MRTSIMERLLLLLFIFPFSLYAQLYPCGEIKYKLCDPDGKEATTASYDTILVYSTAYLSEQQPSVPAAFVAYNGKVDHAYKKLNYVYDYNENGELIPVEAVQPVTLLRSGKFDILDANGKLVLGGFEGVKMAVSYGDGPGGYMYIDLADTLITDAFLPNVINPFQPIIAKKNGLWGAVNMKGQEVLPFQFHSLTSRFHADTLLLEAKLNGTIGLYSLSGKMMFAQKYDFISELIPPMSYYETEVMNWKQGTLVIKQKGKMGLADYYGKEIIPPTYDIMIPQGNNFFIVNDGGKFIVRSRTDTFPEVYDGEGPVVMTLVDSFIQGGKFGLVDKTNKLLIPVKYDFIEVVTYDTLSYFECTTGGTRVEPRSTDPDLYSFYGPRGIFSYNEYVTTGRMLNGKKELYNNKGKRMFAGHEDLRVLMPSVLVSSEQLLYRTDILFIASKNGKQGVYTEKQKKIIPNKYDDIKIMQPYNGAGYLYSLRKGEKYGIANEKGKITAPVEYDDIDQYNDYIIYNKGGKKVSTTSEIWDDLNYITYIDTVTIISGGKYGFIDWSGKVQPGEYDSIVGLAGLKTSNYYGYSEDRVVIVVSNGKLGIVGKNGKVILPAKYDAFGQTLDNEKQFTAKLNGKWGVIDSTGKEILPFKYESAPIICYDHPKAYTIKINGNAGIIGFDGKEILPAIYDNFDSGHPYGTGEDVWVVSKGSKLGIYDKRNRKELIAPQYDLIFPSSHHDSLLMVSIGAVDADPNIYFEKKYRGGKWGMMNTHGKIIIPVDYDMIAPYNEEAGLLKAGKNVKRDKNDNIISADWEYFTIDGNNAADGEKRWNTSYIGKMALGKKPVDLSASWVGTNGPEGADATAFYIDKKGAYWLGTGSSGGVYVSSDEGRTWKEANAGIGPVHVQLMNNINDTMFIKVTGAGFEEPSERSDTDLPDWEKVYYFNKASNSWIRVDSSAASDITAQLRILADTNTGRMINVYPLQYARDNVDRYFVGYEFPQADQMLNYVGIERYIKDSVAVFRKGFPKDMFKLRNGNIYKSKNGTILLGKSGMFRYTNGTSIERLGEKGLIASDVTQVFRNEDGSYFAKTGTSDIWHYDGKAWKKLVDAYKENLNASGSHSGYNTGWMNIEPNGKAIFAMGGSLYEIDKTGNKQLLVKQQEIKEKNMRVMPVCGIRDGSNSNIVHGIALINYLNEDPQSYSIYGTIFNFFHFTYNTASKKLALSDTALVSIEYWEAQPVMFKDKKGNVWVCIDESILPVGNSLQGMDNIPYMRPQTTALGNNGEIAIAQSTGAVCIYDPAQKKWTRLRTPHLGSIDKLGYDNEGNLYAACNYEFEYYCGGKGKLADPGFYRLVFTAAGPEWKKFAPGPNPRILSIAPHPKGLAIGTSGSGLYILDMSSQQASK